MTVAAVGVARSTGAETLSAGGMSASINPDHGVAVSVGGRVVARSALPLSVVTIDRPGAIRTSTGAYAAVRAADGRVVCDGTVTDAGTSVRFADAYAAINDGSVSVDRTVTVAAVGPADAGYRTEVGVALADPADVVDAQPFVPGLWYATANHVPPSGLLADFAGRRDWLFREDRLPLPLAAVRVKATGVTLSLAHVGPDGRSFAGESASAATVIDDRMQFASLGARRTGDRLAVALTYPGVEGDQTRLGHAGRRGVVRAERFHPLVVGATQHYRYRIRATVQPDFDAAMRDAWRSAYAAAKPTVVPCDVAASDAASVGVLDHYFGKPHGVPGLPFAVELPGGRVRDVSYQMGFVGEQLPCAAHLIADGLEHGRPNRVAEGEAIADFWAANTLSPAGVPRVWYDVDPQPHWRAYPTYTRVATDGMGGLLQAWRRMKVAGRDRPRWLACCRSFGDWLVARQNADGSYCRAYGWDGRAVNPSPSATTHPIRFLVDLTLATSDERYEAAAERAGRYAVKDVGSTANYYGGTADNADVTDKEAGWIAFDSFLSLYDVTGDRRWLAAAERAATFTETWAYGWTVPIPGDDPAVALPRTRTTAGLSLIATGHSGADIFLAFAPAAYYRLAVATGDAHWSDVARLLLYDTRQFVDVGGSLSYAVPGLVTEAATLADARGHGVGVWLPWCTAAFLDGSRPLIDAFGTADLDAILILPVDRQQAKAAAYATRHGFPLLVR